MNETLSSDDDAKGLEQAGSGDLIAGECPKCEGDLVAVPDSNLLRCKNCGYEERV